MLRSAVQGNHVHRLLTAALLLLAVLGMTLLSPKRADAAGVWCSGDPTIFVNGSAVSITAHVPMDRLRDVEYVEFVFHVPANAIVGAVVNDSLLFPARITVKKDLPADYKLGTPVTVDMGARIIAVADTYDAITSTRVYREQLPDDFARTEMARVAGTQLDLEVVQAWFDTQSWDWPVPCDAAA